MYLFGLLHAVHPDITSVIGVDLVQSRLQEQVANCRKKNLSSCATQILNMCAALIYNMDDWDLVCTSLASKSRYIVLFAQRFGLLLLCSQI